MNANSPTEFYERLVEGTNDSKEISLSASSAGTLEEVEMSPVSKRVLASVIERLPSEMFDAAESADSAEEAEAELDDQGIGTDAVTEQTVAGFEDLCKHSLSHDELTNHQMETVVEHLSFEKLFELGSEIIEISFESSGEIQDFHEQQSGNNSTTQ